MSIQTIETSRLILRRFEKGDAIKVQELANDMVLAKILGLPHPYLLEHAENWIRSQPNLIESGTEYPLAIVQKEANAIVGTLTLRVDKLNQRGELGYWIGQRYWGSGFATEAAKAIIQFGFSKLNLHRIWAQAITRNASSIRVLGKAGLKKEGVLRQHKKLGTRFEDVVVFGLVKNEF